jgi:tetratricopeptide (TPR) repeat protein
LVGPDDARVAVDWNNIGAVALRRDRYAEAEQAYAEASRVLALDPQAPESRQAWLRSGRGTALLNLGRYAEARVELDAAEEIAQRTLSARHPIVGTVRSIRATLERFAGNLDASIEQATAARALFAQINHPDQAIAEMEIGLSLLALRRNAEALDILRQSEAHFVEQRSREESKYWQTRAALGLATFRLDSQLQTDPIEPSLVAMRERGLVPTPSYAEALRFAAEVAERRGQLDVARSHLEALLEQMTLLFGKDHPRTRALVSELNERSR